jgi:hypothetical protein
MKPIFDHEKLLKRFAEKAGVLAEEAEERKDQDQEQDQD